MRVRYYRIGENQLARGEDGLTYVCLELIDVNVEGTVETERRSQRGDDLGNQPVQVRVRGAFNAKVSATDIVQSLIVQAKGTVRVLQKSMGRKHTIVGFHDGSGNLGRGRDGETKLGFTTVIHTQAFQQKTSESGSGSSTGSVKDKESLESGTVVGNFADAIEDLIDNLLSNGVVTSGVVVGCVLLSTDDLLRVVQLTVSTGADFIAHRGLQIDKDSTRDVLSGRSFREKGGKGVALAMVLLGVCAHATIGVNAMLQAVKFPAGVTSLDTGLTEMDRDTFYIVPL